MPRESPEWFRTNHDENVFSDLASEKLLNEMNKNNDIDLAIAWRWGILF